MMLLRTILLLRTLTLIAAPSAKMSMVSGLGPPNDFQAIIVTFNHSNYATSLIEDWKHHHLLSNHETHKNGTKPFEIHGKMKLTEEKLFASKHQRFRSIRSAKQKDKQNRNSKKSRYLPIQKSDGNHLQTINKDSAENKSHVKYNDQVIHCSGITCYNDGECNDQQNECICLMGFSGKHCEIDAPVRFPKFNGNGFIEFPKLLKAEENFIIKMEFKPENEDGLLLFTSEHPNAMFDFFSVSLLSSKLDFRFDCGSGIAILRTDEKVRLNQWNELLISRHQRHAFIQLNDGRKTIGKSKGQFSRINFQKNMYLGGYANMGAVKDRTGMKSGFHGCVRVLKINDKTFDMRKGAFVGDALAGYNVEECSADVCKKLECFNGGFCQTENAENSFCVCPLGTTGDRCQHKISLIMPMFTGSSSFLQYTGLQRNVLSYNEIEIQFKPTSPDGLIMYNGYAKDKTGDFLSLAMKESYVEYRFDLGSGPAILRSKSKVRLNEWHVVKLSRTGRSGILKVDEEQLVEAMASGAFTQLTLTLDLFLGGHRNFDEVASHAQVNKSFEGCIQKVIVNERPIKMLDEAITGLNVKNCEHVCTNKPCSEIGKCLPLLESYKCSCPLVSTGLRCMQKLDYTTIKIPSFNSNSFLFYKNEQILKKLSGRSTKISLRIQTVATEGLVLWACEEELGPHGDFFSVGVQAGFIQVRYNLGSGDVNALLNTSKIDDGKWHHVKIHRHDRKCYGSVDGQSLQLIAESPGDMRQLTNLASLYIGGMDEISLGTQQQYKKGLRGCLSHLLLNDDYDVDIMKSAVDGANIKHCSTGN